jgi:hypothetical protein
MLNERFWLSHPALTRGLSPALPGHTDPPLQQAIPRAANKNSLLAINAAFHLQAVFQSQIVAVIEYFLGAKLIMI